MTKKKLGLLIFIFGIIILIVAIFMLFSGIIPPLAGVLIIISIISNTAGFIMMTMKS